MKKFLIHVYFTPFRRETTLYFNENNILEKLSGRNIDLAPGPKINFEEVKKTLEFYMQTDEIDNYEVRLS